MTVPELRSDWRVEITPRRTKDSAQLKSPDPFPSLRVGSGDKTTGASGGNEAGMVLLKRWYLHSWTRIFSQIATPACLYSHLVLWLVIHVLSQVHDNSYCRCQ